MVQFLIFIHVMSAIVAFGPSYAAPLIGRMASAEPQHANFAARISEGIGRRITVPVGLSMPVTGLLIVWAAGINLFATGWLLVAIVVYIFAIGYSILVQLPAVGEVVRISSAPPIPGAAPGPPAGLRPAVQKVQRGGILLGILIVVIVGLMVTKPF